MDNSNTTKQDTTRQFTRKVRWITAENVCYLLEGKCDPIRKHYWETKLHYEMRHRKDPTKRMKKLHNIWKDIYATLDYAGDTKGVRNLDHDIKLRNVLAVLSDRLQVRDVESPYDATTVDYDGNLFYIEMDNGTMTERELAEKIGKYYSDNGPYRVIFFMASRPDELEESRLKKLFKISSEVLKGKKGRIIGACYSQFLKDGKIWNCRGQEISF